MLVGAYRGASFAGHQHSVRPQYRTRELNEVITLIGTALATTGIVRNVLQSYSGLSPTEIHVFL